MIYPFTRTSSGVANIMVVHIEKEFYTSGMNFATGNALSRLFKFTVAAIVMSVLQLAAVSSICAANSTTVSVNLRDSLPASITVGQPDIGIINNPNVTLTGTVHNISQIMVYIDGAYNSTVPLDAGADTYTVSLTLAPGQHTIKLIAIDPYTSTQIEKTISVTYDSTAQIPSQGNSGGGAVNSAPNVNNAIHVGANKVGGEVVQAQQDAQGQLNQASEAPGLLKNVADVSYQFLSSVDLISKNDGSGLKTMGWRFVLVTLGLVLAVLPWTVYTLAVKLHIAPALTARTGKATIPVRIIGLLLLIIPFLFLL